MDSFRILLGLFPRPGKNVKILQLPTANYINFYHTFGIWGKDNWDSVG